MSLIKTSEIPEQSFPSGPFSPPTGNSEWRLALVDVKWLCVNQQYKQCYVRCQQLIDTSSEPVGVAGLINSFHLSLTHSHSDPSDPHGLSVLLCSNVL